MLPAPSPTPVPAPRPPGRPRALDDAKLREVCALISAGCGIHGAARYVGCAPSTIRREARRNANFNERLRRANLSAELGPLNAMRQAANTHWRAAAWLLERTEAQRYARQNPRAVKPEDLRDFLDELLEIVAEESTDEQSLRRIQHRFAKLGRRADLESLAGLDPLPPPRRKWHSPP